MARINAPPPRRWEWAVAVDGGTTNTRARLVRDGRVVATARREVGVRDTVLGHEGGNHGSSTAPLILAVADVVREVTSEIDAEIGADLGVDRRPEVIVAAGMLCSEVGLRAVPHVPAPAGIEELAAGVIERRFDELGETPVFLIPGLRTPAGHGPGGWACADVMRGEECETIGAMSELVRRGALDAAPGRLAFLWPGSHCKLVEVEDGRITRSHTSLAGEILQAVARHTLIAASLPPRMPERLDAGASALGAEVATAQGLGRAAFLVRLAAISESLGPEQRASFWIGAVVADDVAFLARHGILRGEIPLWVGGREPLRSLYANGMRRLREAPATALDDDLCETASAHGALAVAARSLAARLRTR